MQLPILPPLGSAPGEGQEKSKQVGGLAITDQPDDGFQRVFGEMGPGVSYKEQEAKSGRPEADEEPSLTREQKRAASFDIGPGFTTPFMDSGKFPEPLAVAHPAAGDASLSAASPGETAQINPLSVPPVGPDPEANAADRGSQTNLGIGKTESGDQGKVENAVETQFVASVDPTSLGAIVAASKSGPVAEAITVLTPGTAAGERARIRPDGAKPMRTSLPEEKSGKSRAVTGAVSIKELRDSGEKVARNAPLPETHAPEAAGNRQEADVVSTPDRHRRADALPTLLARQTAGGPVESAKSRTELSSGMEGEPRTEVANLTKEPPSGRQRGSLASTPVPDFPGGTPQLGFSPNQSEGEQSPPPQSFGPTRRTSGGTEAHAISEVPQPKMPTPPPSRRTAVAPAPPRAPLPGPVDEGVFVVSQPASEPLQIRVPSAHNGAPIAGGQAGAMSEGPRGLPVFPMPLAGVDPVLTGLGGQLSNGLRDVRLGTATDHARVISVPSPGDVAVLQAQVNSRATPATPIPVPVDEAAFVVSEPASEPLQTRVPSAHNGAPTAGGQAGAMPESPRGLPGFPMPFAGLGPALSGLDESRGSDSDVSVAEPRGASPITTSAGSPAPITPHHEAARGVMMQLAQAARANHDRAVELRLHPEELGHVRMTFTTDHGGLTVALTAERGETLDLLRRNIDILGEELRRIGYGSVDFSFGDEHHASGGEAEPRPSYDASGAQGDPALDQNHTDEPPARSVQGLVPVGGGVDMRI